MDDTVNNFLKEINEIVPPSHDKSAENAWKECIDKQSGFPYYWNLHTDEVTWEMPEEYKSNQEKNKHSKRTGLYIPPKSFSGSKVPVPSESVKIYKIESERTKPVSVLSPTINRKTNETKIKQNPVKKFISSTVDSDEEKITLISSYGGDTESEEETEENTTHVAKPPKIEVESEEHILKKLQDRSKDPVTKTLEEPTMEINKEISGFKLVAGYSSDEDEEEESENEVEDKPHSTLFPIQENVNLEQLKTLETPAVVEIDPIDTKIFQRKRKIDIEVVNAQNKPKVLKTIEIEETTNSSNSYTNYLGFKSGGVMFGKTETTEPTINESAVEEKKEDSSEKAIFLEFADAKTTLSEKLAFLSEGHQAVSPVQTMLIQAETLYAAVKHGSLNTKYFQDWLNDTCTDLVKLEQEAAPSGWLLQWDRLNKRYFYQNKSTGESQWEYPQPDVIRCDEAMDISTTPPPPPADDEDELRGANMDPPPPPKIGRGSPQPPPPPVISRTSSKSVKTLNQKSFAPETNSPSSEQLLQFPPLPSQSNEPLPPGVDPVDVELPVTKIVTPAADTLNSALSSFYSEMATITSSTSTVTSDGVQPEVNEGKLVDNATDKAKKKKKTKVKIAQGLAMKKKGVSKLVEKWKNVQNNY